MPSNLSVPVTQIKNLRPHPDADRLQLADVLGWQVVVGKDLYKEGERIVYVPPDSVMPEHLSDALGITKFLSKGRVRQAKLRGEPSFGATIPNKIFIQMAECAWDLYEVPLETDVAEVLGITKYEPPVRPTAGDAEREHELFTKYTSIENLRRYPDVLQTGEMVVLTEKIHGTNCRVGFLDGELVAGSHALQRKRPGDVSSNMYWFPFTIDGVEKLLTDLGKNHKQVILFGETFGKVQKKYTYGHEGKLGFRAFDLFVDGKYLDFEQFANLMIDYRIPQVPVLRVLPYAFEEVREEVEWREKQSTLDESHPMEGVVVKPLKERHDNRIGRVVFKYISDAYLFGKGGSDFKDE